jgi:tRNA threonylcarbamoyl adenosine modification protein YeaZ
MKILALEFSSAQRSVAVAAAGEAADAPEGSTGRAASGVPSLISEVVETGGKGTRAFEMIESALRDAGVEREQLDCLAVGLGPGSYTGIRVAISIAQGWHLATNIKIAAVPTPDILAAQAHSDGLRGKLHIIIDAQRSELYWTSYELSDSSCDSILPLRITKPEEMQTALAKADLIAGPEATKWFPGAKLLYPSAAVLAQLAFERQTFVPAEKLEPNYLRETTFIKAPPPRTI